MAEFALGLDLGPSPESIRLSYFMVACQVALVCDLRAGPLAVLPKTHCNLHPAPPSWGSEDTLCGGGNHMGVLFCCSTAQPLCSSSEGPPKHPHHQIGHVEANLLKRP